MINWKNVTWGEIAKLRYGKGLKDYRNETHGVPVFGTNGKIGYTKTALCSSSGVIIGRKGAYRGVHFSPEPFYVIDTAYWLDVAEEVDPLWAYFNLKTVDINGMDSGSAIPSLSKTDFENLPCYLPEISEQRAIANILGTFDTKIELTQKMNETLEEIAKTLFKSWFIDFDPVRAKAEGRPTGVSKEISDLFPDSFEDSELGEIPEGWKSGNLGTLIEPKRGKVITKSTITPGGVPVVAGGIKPPYYHSESNAKSPIVTISASGTAGYVTIYYEDIWASDCSYINKEISDFVFFAHSFLTINQDRVYNLRHGAVQQHVYPKDLIELQMVIPPISIIEEYENIVSTIHEKIKCNLEEIKTLDNLRDILLPKLISGELKIPDAENLVEEVGI